MPKWTGEAFRFGIVGIAATAVHFAILWTLVELAGVNAGAANGAAFLCALWVSYFGQRNWVFRHSQRNLTIAMRFVVIAALGFFANIAIMVGVTEYLQLDYRIGFIASVITVPAMTFLINKFWVFSE